MLTMKTTRREMARKTLLAAIAALVARIPGRAASSGSNALPASTPEPTAKEGLTRTIADFVTRTRYSNIPEDVIEIGKKSILDGLGLAPAGSVVASGDLSRRYIESLGLQKGGATVIGSALKVSPRFAAFANGVGIHSEDYDDTQLAVGSGRVYGMLTHPTAPVLPAALALGEAKGVSGQDLMLAYHLGVEVETKICEAVNPRLYLGGFHSTGTVGTFGATTAAAKLHGLDAHWTTDAYGIAGAQAAGLQASLGTMTKPFQAGHASESESLRPILPPSDGRPRLKFSKTRAVSSTHSAAVMTPTTSWASSAILGPLPLRAFPSSHFPVAHSRILAWTSS